MVRMALMLGVEGNDAVGMMIRVKDNGKGG